MPTRMTPLILTGLLAAHGALAAECTFDTDRMAIIAGQRTFVLGLYENPAEDAVLDQVANAGFNLVQAQATAESLDRLKSKGLHAWVNTGGAIDFSTKEEPRAAYLDELVNPLKEHPALLVWEVPDEALWNVWYGPVLARIEKEPSELAKRLDVLEDVELQTTLRAKLAESAQLRQENRHLEADAAADGIWEALQETPPYRGISLVNAPAEEDRLRKGLLEGYLHLKTADPAHPVWMNHAPRNTIPQLARFGLAADVVGCDIYPVPATGAAGHSDLADRTLSSVGAYTDRMQASAPGKPVWMVLQGFGWNDIRAEDAPDDPKRRRPKPEESRFMAYDAIVRGARGLLYWGTFKVEKDSLFWGELLALVKELNGLQAVLSAPDAGAVMQVPLEPSYGSLDRGVLALPKETDTGTWYIVVNESPYTLTYRLPVDAGNAAWHVYPDGPAVPREKDILRQTIVGYGVQVLAPQGS